MRREQARLEKSSGRLITAYQEGLVTLAELRQRMPELRQRVQAVESGLQSLKMAAVDQAKYLQLADSLGTFRSKLRRRAETMDTRERQQILRLVVRDVLVGTNTITIRHSIPVPTSGSDGTPHRLPGPSMASPGPSYLLRTGSYCRTLRRARLAFRDDPPFEYSRLQPLADQAEDALVADPMLKETEKPRMTHRVEKASVIGVENPVHLPSLDAHHQRVQGIMLATLRSEPIRKPEEVFLVDRIEHRYHRPLEKFILQRRDP